MTAELKELAEKAAQLSPADRAFLAEHLLDSLEDADLERAWMDEARRRRDEVRSGQVQPVPAAEVYQRIDQLLRK
jgi:putative addiction module component (TIGR02574 family)